MCGKGALLGLKFGHISLRLPIEGIILKENFVSGKMFATINLRKKWSLFSGIPYPKSGSVLSGYLEFFEC